MNQSRKSQTYVFFDTMVFLHCVPVQDMNVPDLLGVDSITLVVPRITIQELDNHKNTHPYRKIRDRSTDRLKTILSCMDSSKRELRSGVRLEFAMARPSSDFEEYGLNMDWQDDELIANVLKYKIDHPTDRVLLISHDVGPKLTATQLGIETSEIPDAWRIPPEDDPLVKENKRLKKEILKLKNAQPELILRLSGMQNDDHHILFEPGRPTETEIPDKAKIIAELRKSYPELHPPVRKESAPAKIPSLAGFMAKTNSGPIPAAEYERYNKELARYFSAYERYLDQLAGFCSQPARTLLLSLEVRNVGYAPAKDVDVYVYFPDGFSLYTKGELPKEPVEPKLPKEPQTATQRLLAHTLKAVEMPKFMPFSQAPFGAKETFSLKRTGSYELREHFDMIKHGYLMKIQPIFLIFESLSKMTSFHFTYEMTAGNLPDKITGQLNVVIQRNE